MPLVSMKVGDFFEIPSISPFKGQKGVTKRIRFLSDSFYGALVHFKKGIGKFYCFGGVCCQEGLPSAYYIFPVWEIPLTPEDGFGSVKYFAIPQRDYESKFLEFNSILVSQGKSITQVDFKVTCDDEKYQKNNYFILQDSYLNSLNPDVKKEVLAFLQEGLKRYNIYLEKSFARTINEEQYLKLEEETPIPFQPQSFQPQSFQPQLSQPQPSQPKSFQPQPSQPKSQTQPKSLEPSLQKPIIIEGVDALEKELFGE